MQLKVQKLLWHCLIFFSILGGIRSLNAQPAGGPMFTNSKNEFTISVVGGHFTKRIFRVKHDSRRFFLKGTYGIGDRLDFFGRVGLMNLELTLSDSARTVLDDGFRIAYGGGMTLRIMDFEQLRLSFFLTGQVFRVISRPEAETALSFSGSPALQVLQMKYDWREGNLTFGVSKQIRSINFYTGASAKIIQRYETKIDKIVFGGRSANENREKGRYISGLLMSPLFGLDLNLPSRLKISLELSANNESDFAVYFGLSQTGKP